MGGAAHDGATTMPHCMLAGCTLVVSGDGRYLTKPACATIIRMAAANGVRKVPSS